MIPRLLWRCPLCHTNDALRHRTHWFRRDEVHCAACGAVWEVTRIIGGDYVLKCLADGAPGQGLQEPLGRWYERMKAGVQLEPLHDASCPLASGEALYLRSQDVRLVAEVDSALFAGWQESEVPASRRSATPAPPMKRLGRGLLFLTNERLCWVADGRPYTWWLRQLNAAFVRPFSWLIVDYGANTPYWFRFRHESALKWLTYLDLIGQRLQQEGGHRIAVPSY